MNRGEELPTFTLPNNTVDSVETRPLCVSIVVDKDLTVSEMTFNIHLFVIMFFFHVILFMFFFMLFYLFILFIYFW